jgi:hypothetical protein
MLEFKVINKLGMLNGTKVLHKSKCGQAEVAAKVRNG